MRVHIELEVNGMGTVNRILTIAKGIIESEEKVKREKLVNNFLAECRKKIKYEKRIKKNN